MYIILLRISSPFTPSPNTVQVQLNQELNSSKSQASLKVITVSEIQNWTYTLPLLRSRINTGFLAVMETTVRGLCILCEASAEVEETVEHLRVLYLVHSQTETKTVQHRAYDTTQHNQMEISR